MTNKQQDLDGNEVEQLEVAMPVSVIEGTFAVLNGQIADLDDPTATRQDTTELSIARNSSFPCSKKQFGFDDVQVILSIIYEEPQPAR